MQVIHQKTRMTDIHEWRNCLKKESKKNIDGQMNKVSYRTDDHKKERKKKDIINKQKITKPN